MVSKLFEFLDTDDRDKRRNAIAVMAMLFSRHVATMPPAFKEKVAQHVLKRLGDEELTLRIDAAALFGHLEPVAILPRLCDKV